MTTIISSIIPFPNIEWWAYALKADILLLDKAEHFEKMSYRNRYYIAGSNNGILLTIPLLQGRNQRITMKSVGIYDKERWQKQHWRTLVSVYKSTPYFDYYEDSLQQLFITPFTYLIDFNLATLHWLKKQLRVSFEERFEDDYIKNYPPEIVDIRGLKPSSSKNSMPHFPKYYQAYESRIGFLPNLSILDILFSEGPNTVEWILRNTNEILNAVKE